MGTSRYDSNFKLEHCLTLMNVYLTEWCHRDDLLWTQVFKYFYATLIVLFLPNLTEKIGFKLYHFPLWIFPIIALFMALLFLYVSKGYAIRLAAISDSYKKVMDSLPEDLQRTTTKEMHQKMIDESKYAHIWLSKDTNFYDKKMSLVLCNFMFIGLMIMSGIMLIYYINVCITP